MVAFFVLVKRGGFMLDASTGCFCHLAKGSRHLVQCLFLFKMFVCLLSWKKALESLSFKLFGFLGRLSFFVHSLFLTRVYSSPTSSILVVWLPVSITVLDMPSIQFFLLAALLAALVVAAPAPVRPGNLQKRSFVVPRQLNKAHPTGLNGTAAMRKVFRKYNFNLKEGYTVSEGFIGQKAHTADVQRGYGKKRPTGPSGAASNQSGTVAANPGQNAALFLSPVDVGGQTLNLDFDSGSSDL